MADDATIAARLEEAEAALHQLLTGAKVVEIRAASGSVQRAMRYAPADVDQLRAYIRDLKRQAGVGTGRRAIGVVF